MARLELKQMREELAEAIEKRKLKPPPAPWWSVGRDQAEAMLAELRGWVETFLGRHYPGYACPAGALLVAAHGGGVGAVAR